MDRPSALASDFRNMPLVCWKSNRTVVSSILTTLPGVPPATIQFGGLGARSLLSSTSSHQNTMSSAVNGEPSDHFMPFLR